MFSPVYRSSLTCNGIISQQMPHKLKNHEVKDIFIIIAYSWVKFSNINPILLKSVEYFV